MNISAFTARIRRACHAALASVAVTGVASSCVLAQQPMHGMRMDDSTFLLEPLGISMDRNGSGTSWIPDAVSLPSAHRTIGAWDVMLHGFVFAQYDKQGSDRGSSQVGSLNWGMLMASHALAGGRFQARTMLSLDPWTVTPSGYPLLLQTGESYHGEPLHDRQHPHDFWMELGATYDRAISKETGISLYVAPSGEPALGPVAFMHRPSAMDIPTAPLGHHWQDATHVSFGVLTAGLFTKRWKLEGSVFNGREPDDNRWNFDPITLDSYSGRVSFNASANWSLSAGVGYLKSPEALHPDEAMHRITAAAMHGAQLGADGEWSTTFVYGANREHGDVSQSVLVETDAVVDSKNTIFGRAEWVEKSAADLVIDTPRYRFDSSREFGLDALTAGYIREVLRVRGATIGLGGSATVNLLPASLQVVYGTRTPMGILVFARLRPTLHRAVEGGMSGMHM